MTYNITPPYSYGNVKINTSSGYVLTAGSSHANWSSAATSPVVVNQGGRITLTGQDADVDINGVSLKETLEHIQEMLGVMKMDPALEREFEELQQAGNRYRELRERFLEQKAVWDTLKDKNL